MRAIMLVGFLLLLLLAATVGGYIYLNATAQQLAQAVERVAAAAERGEWQQAGELLRECNAQWEKQRRTWALLIDHDDMRDVEIGFVDLEVAARRQNSYETGKETAQLKFYLEHAAESERPDIRNVL